MIMVQLSGLNWTENSQGDRIQFMKRRLLLITTILIMSVLAGCGQLVEMPELSEEETVLVTEYAAGLMLKYDSKYSEKLLNEDALMKAKEKELKALEQKKAYEEAAAKYRESLEASKEEDSQAVTSNEASQENTENYIDNIASFYGIDGANVVYTGYSLTDSYPESGDDILFAMDASPGKELLVLNFDVMNVTGNSIDFNMFYRSPNFSLSVNDEKKVHNQSTLLLNDMATYSGNIEAGQTVPMILVFEIPDSTGEIVSLKMKVSGDNGKGTVLLQ